MNQPYKSVPQKDLFWLEWKLPAKKFLRIQISRPKTSYSPNALQPKRITLGARLSCSLFSRINFHTNRRGGRAEGSRPFPPAPGFAAAAAARVGASGCGGRREAPAAAQATARRLPAPPPRPTGPHDIIGTARDRSPPAAGSGGRSSAAAAAAALRAHGERRPCRGRNGPTADPSPPPCSERADGSAPASGCSTGCRGKGAVSSRPRGECALRERRRLLRSPPRLGGQEEGIHRVGIGSKENEPRAGGSSSSS